MAATVSSLRVVAVLGQLAWAYFARAAARDWARAGVVLAAFQKHYTTHRAAVQAANTSDVALPSSLSVGGSWDATERTAAQVVLAINYASTGPARFDQALPVLEAMPEAVVLLPEWFRTRLAPLADPGIDAVERLIASLPLAEVAGAIDQYISVQWGTHTATSPAVQGAFDPARLFSMSRSPSQPSSVVSGEEIPVFGTRPTQVMPTWGWVVLGLGFATATTVLVWGVWRKRNAGAA